LKKNDANFGKELKYQLNLGTNRISIRNKKCRRLDRNSSNNPYFDKEMSEWEARKEDEREISQ